jgi:hypothetical protein
MVRIFFDHIRDRYHLEGFRSVHIRVRIFNIRYHIRIRIFKSHICDVNIQSYPIRHGWYYPYSNPNLDRNMKTNVISVVSVHIRSVFISNYKIEQLFIISTKEKLNILNTHMWSGMNIFVIIIIFYFFGLL